MKFSLIGEVPLGRLRRYKMSLSFEPESMSINSEYRQETGRYGLKFTVESNFVRKKLLGNSALSNSHNVHFLLNGAHCHRYQNKLLKGSHKIIESQLPVHMPELGDRQSLLDLLMY